MAGETVTQCLREAFDPLKQSSDLAKNKPSVKYDVHNQALWIKVVKGSAVSFPLSQALPANAILMILPPENP